MNTILHTKDSRGTSNLGWLQSNFSFSFAGYHNPERMGFGLLRVFNDDTVAPGKGFGSHPHENMEIISIVTKGALEHKDNNGGHGVMVPGDVQVMSAGRGIVHSEFNHSAEEEVKFFQLWIHTKEDGIAPRHDQKTYELTPNQLTKVVTGDKDETDALYIHQDANIYRGVFDTASTVAVDLTQDHGAYVFVVSGQVKVGEQTLNERDALGVSETTTVNISAQPGAEVIIVDVPMNHKD